MTMDLDDQAILENLIQRVVVGMVYERAPMTDLEAAIEDRVSRAIDRGMFRGARRSSYRPGAGDFPGIYTHAYRDDLYCHVRVRVEHDSYGGPTIEVHMRCPHLAGEDYVRFHMRLPGRRGSYADHDPTFARSRLAAARDLGALAEIDTTPRPCPTKDCSGARSFLAERCDGCAAALEALEKMIAMMRSLANAYVVRLAAGLSMRSPTTLRFSRGSTWTACGRHGIARNAYAIVPCEACTRAENDAAARDAAVAGAVDLLARLAREAAAILWASLDDGQKRAMNIELDLEYRPRAYDDNDLCSIDPFEEDRSARYAGIELSAVPTPARTRPTPMPPRLPTPPRSDVDPNGPGVRELLLELY